MQKDWYDNLLLIADFIPPNPDEFEKCNIKEQVKIIRELGFNSQHIEVSDVTVGEAGITFFNTDHGILKKRDLLKEYCDAYEEFGGNAIVYFNVHWLAESLCRLKPNWYQRDSSGKKILIGYGSGGISCVNSPFREWALNIIRDIGRYNIKGIFLDGPFFDLRGCYCESCQSKFKKIYKFSLTPENLKDKRNLRKFLEFKQQSITEFVRDARAILKSVNPGALIYINSPQVGPNLDGRNNRLTIAYQDALLAEGGFLYSDLRKTPIWKPGLTAKLLETQAEGKPYIVAIAGRLGPWSRYLLPHAETWLTYAEAIANGANIWYGIYDSNRNDERMKTVKEINEFLSSNSEVLTKTVSIAKIALVWSYKTANYYQTSIEFTDFTGETKAIKSELKNDALRSFYGWYEVLSRSHRLFDVIDDYFLEKQDLSKYELVILPNIACMGNKEADKIKEYVAKGGHIIATFDTSLYDENGCLRENLALKDLLGVKEVRGIEKLPHDHIAVEKSDYTKGIDQPLIPVPHLYLQIIPSDNVRSIMKFREKQPSRYCELPPETTYPFIVENKVGNGIAVFFTGNIDTVYDAYRLPEHFKIMANAIDLLSKREIFIDDSLTSLDLNVRKKGNKYIIHLINYTSYSGRPISNVVALENINLSLHIGSDRINTVRSLKNEDNVKFDYKDGYLNITVPKIQEYEILVAEQ